MRHWLGLLEADGSEIATLVAAARALKSGRRQAEHIRGRTFGMLFANPSLRTRVSFEAALGRFGGRAISLSLGGDSWALEHRDGVVMDGDRAEHVREAAAVLSRYVDGLGLRTFAKLADAAEDRADAFLCAFARYATVPVVSLESAFEHPCQGLADRMTLEEQLESPRGRHFVLTWAPHVKPLPQAVPHSALLAGAGAQMRVTLAHPPGYELHADVIARAKRDCTAAGAAFEVTDDQAAACATADAIYVKSWGSPRLYGNATAQRESFAAHRDWQMTPRQVRRAETRVMHCLPVRRNVVMCDALLDDPRCVVVEQAENRMWAQAALLDRIWTPQSTKGT